MADVNLGNITAHLAFDASQFQRGIQASLQTMQQFSSAMSTQAQQTTSQLQAALQRAGQATTGLSQSQREAVTSAQRLGAQLSTLGQQAQESGQQASRFGSVWQGALSVAGGLGLATGIGALVSAFKNAATSAVETGTKLGLQAFSAENLLCILQLLILLTFRHQVIKKGIRKSLHFGLQNQGFMPMRELIIYEAFVINVTANALHHL